MTRRHGTPVVELAEEQSGQPEAGATIRERLGRRSIVLVGMMGAGKSPSAAGWRAGWACPSSTPTPRSRRAAGMTIPEIFANPRRGRFPRRRAPGDRPPARRRPAGARHRRRRLHERARPATGSRENGVSVWLKAELDVLMRRVAQALATARCCRPRIPRGRCASSSRSATRSMRWPTSTVQSARRAARDVVRATSSTRSDRRLAAPRTRRTP